MPIMRTGAGGERWGRLLLVVLLLLPLPAALDLYGDAAESDENRLRVAAGVLSDSEWALSAPTSVRLAAWPDPHDPVIAGWICLTPSDRAPPRA
jgi:hypothetical protein